MARFRVAAQRPDQSWVNLTGLGEYRLRDCRRIAADAADTGEYEVVLILTGTNKRRFWIKKGDVIAHQKVIGKSRKTAIGAT